MLPQYISHCIDLSFTARTTVVFFFFNDTATTEIYTLSLHDVFRSNNGEFDPGSGLTLAACLTHASQGERSLRGTIKLADG